MSKHICVVTGSRADYGILRPVMHAIKAHPKLKLSVVCTGMHLHKAFGNTHKEVEKEFTIHKAGAPYLSDDPISVTKNIGESIVNLAHTFHDIGQDITLVLGDRSEILAASIASCYMNIPLAHIHGGDKSEGGLDESARHAITKLAHIHLAATKTSAMRIRKMGEQPWRIHVVGAPGLDSILHDRAATKKEIEEFLGSPLPSPLIFVTQHSISTQPDAAAGQMRKTLDTIENIGAHTIISYPNSDAGGPHMIKEIEKRTNPLIHRFASIPHHIYLGILRHADVMVGNSSSGIIEAPSMHLPVVNIGRRQHGRERATNVIDVDHDSVAIERAIKKAMTHSFKKKCATCVNPYGDGRASDRIATILAETRLDQNLLQKQITY
ncbi:MAG: UDP-N-acetylglucosamine 2-epimerase [Nanoarchaeota archaeon]